MSKLYPVLIAFGALVSSALAAIATYLYFFYPSIARDKAVPSDIDGHDI